jgi:hypothetical protein
MVGRGREGGVRDELGRYESLGKGKGVEDWDGERVRIMRSMGDSEVVKSPMKRWGESWQSSILASYVPVLMGGMRN